MICKQGRALFAKWAAAAPCLCFLLNMRVDGLWRRLGKALDYRLKCWTPLSRYADSGHLSIENNPVENGIRPIALGKKIGSVSAQSARVTVPLPYKLY